MKMEKRNICFKCNYCCEGCFYWNTCPSYMNDDPNLEKAQEYFPVYFIGLVKGRHDIPVEDYIFEEIKNPRDVKEMNLICTKFFARYSKEGNKIKFLRLYVTGLSQALCVVLAECQRRGIEVRTMHWDREREEYYEIPTISL